jgi:hypothetical protein
MKSLVALLFAVTACSSAPPKDPPDFLDDQRPPPRAHRDEEAVLEGAPLEPAPSGDAPPSNEPSAIALSGSSTTTNTFGFGGDPYACRWQITMRSLVLDVQADAATGEVRSATFRAEAVEQTVPPCEAKPYPRHEHAYVMAKATMLSPRVTRIELAPKATNLPLAEASIDVDLSKTPATASIRVHRTDQSAPLDWTVIAKLTLETK